MNVAILLWDDVELLTFAGQAHVFSEAGEGGVFYVYTVAESRYPIVSQGFLEITPEYAFHESPRPDVVIVPAGGVAYVRQRHALLRWLREVMQAAHVVLAVSPGDELLAAAGVPTRDGLEVEAAEQGKVVVVGDALAAMEAAILIVARLCGDGVGHEAARYIERPTGASG